MLSGQSIAIVVDVGGILPPVGVITMTLRITFFVPNAMIHLLEGPRKSDRHILVMAVRQQTPIREKDGC